MTDVAKTIEAVWKIESARLIAGLARMVRDVGLAEELAQDAMVTALEKWPESGIPDNPGAWLMQTAKNRALDQMRRRKMSERKHEEIGRDMDEEEKPDLDAKLDERIGDDMLRLVFTACHPILSMEARVALTLRMLCGLTTQEIARAFLLPEPTIQQRIVRAKKTLADANIPFELPKDVSDRLASVLEVVYLVFNEGYAATSGDDWMRPALCEDALRLGRVLAELAPTEPEVHGLVALMEIQASRMKARTSAKGDPILLLDQNRAKWDQLLIRRGLAALERAEKLGRGTYVIQAAIAACHARARRAEDTDWRRIASLYAELVVMTRSPIVELNRAVAIGFVDGPAAGLAITDRLAKALEDYHLLYAVRADFFTKLKKIDDAKKSLERAIELCKNEREIDLMRQRMNALMS